MEQMVGKPAELQIFLADHENHKEGRGFYKMDENNIQLLWEEFTEEFFSLAQTHNEEIKKLL